MKKLKVRFERDKTLSDVEIIVRAGEENAQVKEIIESLTRGGDEKLMLLDKNGITEHNHVLKSFISFPFDI